MGDIEIVKSKAVGSVLSKSLGAVTPALGCYKMIRNEAQLKRWNKPRDAKFVKSAIEVRERRLPLMVEVDQAERVLFRAFNGCGTNKLNRSVAAAIISKVYRSLGERSDPDLLDGTLDLLL